MEARDFLGRFCFILHLAVMIYIVLGWLIAWRPANIFYLVFIPAVFLQWQINQNSCFLNNLEGWLRTGKWRNKEINPEEGAWLLQLATRVTGISFTPRQIDMLTYSALVVLWLLGLARLMGRF